MADLQISNTQNNSKKRAKKQSTRVDMTPMVDLAFLLLTFFILTATFSKPKSMELTYPAPGKSSDVKNGITFLLSKENRLFYYEGEFRNESSDNHLKTELRELSFSQSGQKSLHSFLLYKNKSMQDQIKALDEKHTKGQFSDTTFKRLVLERKAHKDAFTFLIKTDEHATYENVIDVIDELNINVVGKYVMADLIKPEQELVSEFVAVK